MRKDIAKIRSTTLGTEDHGILTCTIEVAYDTVSMQTVGNYALDTPLWGTGDGFAIGDRPTDDHVRFVRRIGTAYGMEFIRRVMKAVGVKKWEDIPGRTIYVLQDLPEGSSSLGTAKVLGIENLPTEPGERFLFADLRDDMTAWGLT